MGWKTIKEHYQIKHHVQVTAEGICIGSGYIHDLIVIGPDGKVAKPYRERDNNDLARYQRDFDADPAKLAELVGAPDTFAASITVYTYDSTTHEIAEKQCEVPGWPNVTHDGEMMFENTFSTDRAQVVEWARRDCELALRWARERREDLEKELAENGERIRALEASIERLAGE